SIDENMVRRGSAPQWAPMGFTPNGSSCSNSSNRLKRLEPFERLERFYFLRPEGFFLRTTLFDE
ncbi:MAG: hypothetical protein ACREQA_24905, partial [Candidatus Binatia bacterium]